MKSTSRPLDSYVRMKKFIKELSTCFYVCYENVVIALSSDIELLTW